MTATHEQTAARRYRIERYLTEGGMGAIYIGKKLGPGGFEKEVVLKQLLPEYTSRPEFRDLFFREAKISATLDHANIVHTFDLVESDESLFIVMEYVRGADLRTIIRRSRLRRRELAPAASIHIAMEILSGLGYAHARRDPSGTSLGIIHRDVSPSNVICSAQGEVKLSDFGIAKASTHSSVFYRVRGKVGYMSPEQARNESIDHRSDLYSLAVCLYEALTAERLFVGDLSTPPDVIYGQPIIPPSHKRKALPEELDEVMARGLATKPADRYQDAIAFAEALRHVAHRYGLLCSAPELAEHLAGILGPDPARWMHEDPAATAEQGTQKIPVKDLEGKEASSIGVVAGSNLYVVNGGGDVVSPGVVGKGKSDPAIEPRIPIEEDDDDEPTRSREEGAYRRRPTPPPPPAAAFAPRVPEEPTSGDSPFEGFTPSPPPPSLFGDEFAAPTPPPPRSPAGLPPPGRPPLGRAAYPNAPVYGPGASPDDWAPAPGGPPLNLRGPETIDFGSGAPPVAVRRSGPPGLLVLIVLLAGAAGGAKLAQIVTRQDVTAMERRLQSATTEATETTETTETTAPAPPASPGAPAR